MKNLNLCNPCLESMILGRNPPQFILAVLLLVMVLFTMTAYADLDGDFAASPIKSRALNWYWLNGTIENNEMDRQLTALRDSCGFSGVVPCFASNNWVTTSGFLDRFHHMMDKCDELGMRVCINDDFYFPSGSAGSTFSNYPQFCMRIITKTEKDVTGPASVQMTIPLGTLMGCVAMSNSDHSVRTDITSSASNGSLSWNAHPEAGR